MIELVAIAAVLAALYLFLQILGPRPQKIFISTQERQQWAGLLAGRFGKTLYVSNVAATLVSLATVYVFFIGSSQLFGYFIAVCVVSIIAAAPITVRFTNRLLTSPLIAERINQPTASAAAITSLFWSEKTKSVSRTIQVITQTSILCILWLEFATLAKMFGGLFGIENLLPLTAVMFFAALFTFDFTIRNGLRGFIFADLLLFPLILIGTITLLGGALYLLADGDMLDSQNLVSPPKFPVVWCIIFSVATLFLNSFLLVTSESHWVRVWSMRDQVQTATSRSLMVTAVVWIILIFMGLLIVALTKRVGLEAVVDVVHALMTSSRLFSIAFWVAAIAAMASTADAQIYSFLLISSFKSSDGTLTEVPRFVTWPFVSAAVVAMIFSTIFLAVEASKFPFEAIVFFIFPIFLCVVPAFVELMCTQRVTPHGMLVSIGLYAACGVAMVLFPAFSFPLSLSAPLMPALVSVWIYFRSSLLRDSGAK